MVDLLVVADDLTGALDTGAQFARLGLRTRVGWTGELPGEADVWVLDTETRELNPVAAHQCVLETVRPLAPRVARIYKKVDSTLRGNIGVELAALLEAGVASRLVLAPAFPAQGRTTRGGQQWVWDVPLSQTPFAQPGVDCSSIPSLLGDRLAASTRCLDLEAVRRGPEALAAALRSGHEPVVVVDAVNDADLAIIAHAACQAGLDRLLAGSAGLAAHLPAAWGLPGTPLTAAPGPVAGPILFVAASQHPALAGQLAYLRSRAEVAVVGQVLEGLLIRGGWVAGQRSASLAAALARGQDAVLTTQGEPRVAGAERRVAACLAEVVGLTLAQARPAALVLTGGDVAGAVCRGLSAQAIVVEGEVEPGIPWGRLVGGPADGMRLVTKAGGFGSEQVFWHILQALRA